MNLCELPRDIWTHIATGKYLSLDELLSLRVTSRALKKLIDELPWKRVYGYSLLETIRKSAHVCYVCGGKSLDKPVIPARWRRAGWRPICMPCFPRQLSTHPEPPTLPRGAPRDAPRPPPHIKHPDVLVFCVQNALHGWHHALVKRALRELGHSDPQSGLVHALALSTRSLYCGASWGEMVEEVRWRAFRELLMAGLKSN